MLNRPIRVLYMIGGGEFGGAEQHVLSLINGLDPVSCVAEVICFYDAQFAERVRQAGIPVTVVREKRIKPLYENMKTVLDRFQPDIIHTHGVRANFVGRIIGKLERIPTVTTIHSIFALDYPNRVKRSVFFTLERLTRPFVSRFIAVSESMKEKLIEENVKADCIDVIYNGIDTDYFIPNPNKQQNVPPVVVTVARLHPVKGHQQLLDAIPSVQTPAIYIFVGDGELRAEIEQIVRERKLPVMLAGHQQNILSYYQKADLIVQTSISEGFSLSMAEALACEVPVVTTRVGGCIEIAKHMDKGVILVDVGDTNELASGIDRMLSSSVVPDREQIVEHFSMKKMVECTVITYEQLLNKNFKNIL